MADAVTSQTIVDTPHKLVMKFTNTSDGTGESAVTKVDVSGFTAGLPIDGTTASTCTEVTIDKIWVRTSGLAVNVLWDATSDVQAIYLGDGGPEHWDFTSFGGLRNNAGSGKTGDIQFTTVGHANTETYWIVLEMTKLS